MIKTLLFDFSRVLLHPTDQTYTGSLNNLHRELKEDDSYYLFNYFELNQEILDFAKTIKDKFKQSLPPSEIKLCIFTTDIIQNDPLIKEKIDPIFDKIYSANELGITKRDPESYKFIADDLGVKPEEIFFTDDTEGNIEAAKEAGLRTYLFVDNEGLIKCLQVVSSA